MAALDFQGAPLDLSGQTVVAPRTRALRTSASSLQPFSPLAAPPSTTPPPEVQAAIAQSHQDAQAAKGGDAAAGDTKKPTTPQTAQQDGSDDAIDKMAKQEKDFLLSAAERRRAQYAMVPEAPTPLPPPQPQQTNPLQAWGSLAMMVAALGGMMSRGHATTALKAASGVLDAFHKGDVEASQQAFEQWKVSNENMQQTFKFQMDRLNADMQIADSDEKLGLAMFNTDKEAFGMKMDAARTKIDMQRAMTDMATAQAQLADISARMPVEYAMRAAAINLMQTPEFKNAPPAKQAEMLQPFLAALSGKAGAIGSAGLLSDDDATMLAQMRLAGDPTALQGLGYGGTGAANRALVEHKIAQLMKQEHLTGADLAQRDAEFFGTKASERALGTRAANADMAVTEAQGFIPLVLQKARAVPRGRFVPFNIAQQLFEAGTSDPNLAAFTASVNSFINVYARAIAPTGVPTQSDKDHARDILSVATSEEAFEAQMNVLDSEMNIAKHAPAEVLMQIRNEDRVAAGLPPLDATGDSGGGAPPPDGPGLYTDSKGRKSYWDGTKWSPQ